MTGPVTIDANTRGYDALMATLIGTATVQTATFGTRVREQIARQNRVDTKTGSKAGA